MKCYSLCQGIEEEMCLTCARCFKNNAPADIENPKQSIIQPPQGPHCAYYMPDHRLTGEVRPKLRHEIQPDLIAPP